MGIHTGPGTADHAELVSICLTLGLWPPAWPRLPPHTTSVCLVMARGRLSDVGSWTLEGEPPTQSHTVSKAFESLGLFFVAITA